MGTRWEGGGSDDINSLPGRDPSIYGPDLNSISFGLDELGNPTESYFYIRMSRCTPGMDIC